MERKRRKQEKIYVTKDIKDHEYEVPEKQKNAIKMYAIIYAMVQ